MSLLTLVSSQRLAVSQTGFINSLGASTINVSSLFSPSVPSVSSLVSTTTSLQISIISTSSGLTGSLLSTTAGLDALDAARLVSTSAGLSRTIGSSASSFSTTLGNFQAGFPSTVSTSYGTSFTTSLLNPSTVSFVNIQPSLSNLWVAVGGDATQNNRLKYSFNGVNWLNSSGTGFTSAGYGVAWNGRVWVALGFDSTQNNTIKYSFDGINWSNSAGTGFTSFGLAASWNGRLWVAVGGDSTANNTIKYSADGINWSNSVGSGFSSSGRDIAWNGRIWVAVGIDSTSNNNIKYSFDGISWSNSISGAFSGYGSGIAWNGMMWVAVGSDTTQNNRIKYSFNGVNWSNSAGAGFDSEGIGIAWNGNLWIAVGNDSTQNNTIKYSADGINWINSSGPGFTSSGRKIAWNGTLWVAVGNDSTQNNTIKYSANGINWSNSSGTGFSASGWGVSFSSNLTPSYSQSNLAILPQNIPLFLTSTNTIFIQPSSLIINNTLELDGTLNRVGVNCNTPQFSLDVAGTLNVTSTSIFTALNLSSITSNLWLAGGFAGGANAMRFSFNGINWNTVPNPPFISFQPLDIAYNGRLWVATGIGQSANSASSIAYSFDGLNWSWASTTGTFYVGSNVRWNGQYWLVAGADSFATVNNMMRSVDGIIWTGITGGFPGGGNGEAASIAWGGDKWVAGGRTSGSSNSIIKYSFDGYTWFDSLGTGFEFDAAFNRNCTGVEWNGNTWVAVGSGLRSILWSSNGIFWNPTVGSPLSFGGGGSVAWGQDKWVAVGLDSNNTGNTMVYSFDGINWQGTNGVRFPRRGYKVVYNGNYWLASGSNSNTNSNILISQDGINWSATTNTGATMSFLWGLGYSSNQGILYNQPAFQILQSNIATPITSTHTLTMTLSTLAIDNTLYVNRYINSVGINKPSLGYSLDVNGSLNTSTLFINTSSLATVIASLPGGPPSYPSTVSTNYSFSFNTSSLITSSINYIAIPPNPLSIYVGGAQSFTAGERLRWSVDGINWNNITTNTFSSNALSIVWNGSMWVATGNDTTSNNRIKYSYDGSNWFNSLGLTFSGGGRALGWNGRYWIAVGSDSGNGTIKYSLNGINWSNCLSGGFTSFGFGVGWNGSFWVACGGFETNQNANIKYSFDGLNWSNSVSGAFQTGGSSSGGESPVWNGRMWVAVGFPAAESIKYSFDGSNWSNGNNLFSSSGSEVAWNGQLWVAVGSDSASNATIKYSSDGINWSNVPTNGFNFSGRSVIWNGRFWLAGGSTVSPVDRQKISFDGINWTSFSNIVDFLAIGFTSNLTPSYSQTNLSILPQNIPFFLTSTNTIFAQPSSLIINNTLEVDATVNRVGINCNIPRFNLDVAGTANTFQLQTSNMTVPVNTSNMWVALGGDSTAAARRSKFSFDGITWSNAPSTIFNNDGYGLAFNGRLWVAVGCNTGITQGTIKYSFDGLNWTNSLGSAFSASGYRVAWNGRMWVAVGEDATANNTIKYSMDGITWSNSAGTGFTSGLFQAGLGVAWNGRFWVAVGSDNTINNTIKYSLDGITWSNSINGGFVNGRGRGVAWNGRMWVAVGTNSSSNDSIKYSFDGLNWLNSPGSIFNQAGNTVSWNGYFWVAGGQDTTSNNRFKYSFDGINWSNSLSGAPDTSVSDVAWNGSLWVAACLASAGTSSNSTIKYSADGLNWSNTLGVGFTLGSGNGIGFSSNPIPSFSQNSFMIAPQNLPLFLTSTNSIVPLQSSMILNDTLVIDGQWDRVGINCNVPRNTLDVAGGIGASFIDITQSPTTLSVAVGTDATQNNRIKYSFDGLNWNNSLSGAFTGGGCNAGYNGREWVAVGGDSSSFIKYSFDGINWLAGQGIANGTGNGVAWNGRLWIVLGSGGGFSSSNGITWTNIPGLSFPNGNFGIAWNGFMWVAVGYDAAASNNCIKYSFDGLSWSNSLGAALLVGYSVAWNGQLWVALGEPAGAGTIIYSLDGITWSAVTSGAFDSEGRRVAWNGRMWVAVGLDSTANNRIKYSLNGLTWSNSAGASFSSSGRGIVWSGNYWIAVGVDSTANNTIKYSTDGINWINSSGSGFTTGGYGLAFSSNAPSYNQRNLSIFSQNVPLFLTSTNSILAQPSSLMINNTLVIDEIWSRVGINCNSPAYALDVVGEINSSGGTRSNGTFLTSDRRIKENIVSADLDLCYSNIKQLPLRRFEFIPEFKITKYDGKQIGFIADEVSTVFPKSVKEYPTSVGQWSTIHFLNYEQIFLSHYGATQKLMNLVEQQASTLEGQAFTLQTLTSTVQGLQKGV